MDTIILQALLTHYETTTNVDRYGQIPKVESQVHTIIKDAKVAARAIEFLRGNKSKYFELRTYGGRFGNYEAISIVDSSILQQVQDAVNKNKSVKDRLNSL